LPNSIVRLRDHCGYNEEVRIISQDPNAIQGATWHNYFATAQFQDRPNTTIANTGYFLIDTYWLNSSNDPTGNGGANNGGRTNMDKMCFNQSWRYNPNPPKIYYRPGGTYYTC
jgi:hypothetical protein